jgi:carboxypeptidase C (cathepsin A)
VSLIRMCCHRAMKPRGDLGRGGQTPTQVGAKPTRGSITCHYAILSVARGDTSDDYGFALQTLACRRVHAPLSRAVENCPGNLSYRLHLKVAILRTAAENATAALAKRASARWRQDGHRMSRTQPAPTDSVFLDETPYGYGKDDSITDQTESAAVTYKEICLNGTNIPYVARAGHLVTSDLYTSQKTAKIFYVSFTATSDASSKRPITFFYNGGPGSSSVYLLLGSFGPRRIETGIHGFTPPAPYVLEDNRDCFLDKTDLVFINPVGTAYSTAIAPRKNGDFWGVDEDAQLIKQFVKRYLSTFNRWNSPKFLFGESYGTTRRSWRARN